MIYFVLKLIVTSIQRILPGVSDDIALQINKLYLITKLQGANLVQLGEIKGYVYSTFQEFILVNQLVNKLDSNNEQNMPIDEL